MCCHAVIMQNQEIERKYRTILIGGHCMHNDPRLD